MTGRRLRVLALVLLTGACGRIGYGLDAGLPADGTVAPASPDLAIPDLAIINATLPDLTTPDLATPDLQLPDFARPDLASPDLRSPDLAQPDLAVPDLAQPDLAVPDLSSAPPDLTAIPDLSSIIDMTYLPDITAPAWSDCVNISTSYTSCDTYCQSLGKICLNACFTTSAGWGARAWNKGTTPFCQPGNAMGNTTCNFTWDDVIGASPRWECCCL